MAKLQGRFNDGQDSTIPPLAVTGLTATDVGTNRPFLATANTTSEASAANTGGAITLSWSVSSNSPAATSYTVTTSPSTYAATVSAPATSYTFQGLASNASYTFTVVPVNSFGNGISTTSSSTLATTVPDKPTGASATGQVDQDTISWSAPSNNGGKAISNYYVLGSDNTSGNTTSTSITIGDSANTSQYYTVYADNANGRSAASDNSNTVTTLPPSFFSPPFFPPGFFAPPFFPPSFFAPPFFPPGFFAPPFFPPSFFAPPFFPPSFFAPPFFPPGFFAPPFFPPGFFSPPFFCIDEDTPIATVSEDGSIVWKKAKDIVIGEKVLSIKLDGLGNEFELDPYTWSSDSLNNIESTVSEISNILTHVKDVTMTINGDQDKRFSLEQTILIKRNNVYFFGSTGSLEIGDIVIERQNDETFIEVEVSEITMIDEQRNVFEFDASPSDLFIAANLIVHNKKIFA